MADERDEEQQMTNSDADTATADDPDTLRAQLQSEREAAERYRANWQRAAADYQNFKRRVEEERSDVARFANAAMVINLLPLLDDLERALQTVDSSLVGLTWVDGIRLIYRKFQAAMQMAGVEEIEADARDFDPAIHEAVAQQPGPENKVLHVVQKGYRVGERVVRPAMVIVGNGQAADGESAAAT
jgi:molecular chaperone GrpE